MPERTRSFLAPPLPKPGASLHWGRLHGSAPLLAMAEAAATHPGLTVVVQPDPHAAEQAVEALRFFLGERTVVDLFPDWETLPYDLFSPHEDIVSRRLGWLHRLPSMERGVLVVSMTTLQHRMCPRDWLQRSALHLEVGQRLELDAFRRKLEEAGYTHVSQVMHHGEFAVRGGLVDLYPMGSEAPIRIDLFDDEIETLRLFDPETQKTTGRTERVHLFPAREFPTDEAARTRFRQAFRARFEGAPMDSLVYREVSAGRTPAGIEYYLPLFFEHTDTFFDYLPENTLFIIADNAREAAHGFDRDVLRRYESRRHDRERPLLPPEALFLDTEAIDRSLAPYAQVQWSPFEHPCEDAAHCNLASAALPDLTIRPRAAEPAAALLRFLSQDARRTLFVAESAGRQEYLQEVLAGVGVHPREVSDWSAFIEAEAPVALCVAPLEEPLHLPEAGLAVITEAQLFGPRARQQRRARRRPGVDPQSIIRNLADLHPGAPVVHAEHGIGRYVGLHTLEVGGQAGEFLTLEYAGGDKLYVPVTDLHLVTRYTGASPEAAPLHKLGSGQWERARKRAAKRARDAAAELLELYARRAARQGTRFQVDSEAYRTFAAAFPFEETPDQSRAIEDVLADMASGKPMDRVVCGDVGFGKTEVAMRAAFVAAENGRQVAVLAPTTLLVQQHLQTFRDRFAGWPIRIEALSRFGSAKAQRQVLADLAEGKVDVVIGTHKLLQPDVRFKHLGLVIVDEEHRFGVRHKERLKALRAEVDLLTLTATPIPRTLNMSLAGLRDLSIIATPPVARHAIKTFVSQWNDALIQEAVERELRRGGQVYFVHNEVKTIEKEAARLRRLLPGVEIRIAHGQMPERELEQVMLDFYHQRFQVLLCTTIIESGIDVPTANTIVIQRADRFGLSQLHQLRGRVGRSHHRAYAYLLTPPKGAMTADAVKRLEAVEALEDLGVGFTLATHDLEIRGAGELLGEEQSGQIQEVGFALYNELLERAVQALKRGEIPDTDAAAEHGVEVDLGAPALLPDDYVPDVHTRLVLYKRISTAADEGALRELQVEMIDRFGLLPEPAKTLFETIRLKLQVAPLGIRKLELGPGGGRIRFAPEPQIDTTRLIGLIQREPQRYRLQGEWLRFESPMPEVAERVRFVTELLQTLSPRKEAA